MKGLLFIPDISGFTKFVKSMDEELGAFVIRELLNTIITCNTLHLELSEVEGDALLFYKTGQPFPVNDIIDCFNNMHTAFHKKYHELKERFNISASLSLKLIVHYGELNIYDIRGFTKLYGKAVIEAHRLLKNGQGKSDYILVTNEYLLAASKDTLLSSNVNWKFHLKVCQLFKGLCKISYTIYAFCPNSACARALSFAA